ncbi:MAG: tetratricopeptide repeat protein [Myxococcales bacterium]
MRAVACALLVAAGFWTQAGRAVRRLWEKPEPSVVTGNALAASGDVDGAIKAYEGAKVPENSPADAALAFNRASALLRRGDTDAAPRALADSTKALQQGDASVKPLAAYDLGYALEQSGKPEEAVNAYAQALALDPTDRDAKVNLELLLKEEQRNKKQQQSVGRPDEQKNQKQQGKDDKQKKQQGGQPQDNQAPKPGEEKKNDKAQASKNGKQQDQDQKGDQGKEQRSSAQEQPDREPTQDGKARRTGKEPDKSLDRSEAQRLLDALQAGEKNLQVWRFTRKKRERQSDVEKDW